jgi:hypothetical protein
MTRWDFSVEGTICPRCKGTTYVEETGDLHRSPGMIPCPGGYFQGHGVPTCKDGKLVFSDYDKKNRAELMERYPSTSEYGSVRPIEEELTEMDREEALVEKIALLLFPLEEEELMRSVANQAAHMAVCASRGWWERPGSPAFNTQMARFRKKLQKQGKSV